MKEILILSRYSRLGSSSRLRMTQYIPFLSENELNITQKCFFNDRYLMLLYNNKKISKFLLFKFYLKRVLILLNAKKYDLIWIEKEIFPYFPAMFEYALNKFNIPYIVDYDDAVFHNYDLSKNKYIKKLLGNKIDNVMKYSSIVIAGNQYISERAKLSGAKEVVIIPTVVDIERYSEKVNYQSDIIIVGWIGSPYTQKYLVDIIKILEKMSKSNPIRLVLVGANHSIQESVSELDIEVLPWSENMEAEYIKSFDIGIMPLVDGPWEKGKCGYKLIQYMASGVPVIASPVGVNVEIVMNNQCGYLAGIPSEWEVSFQMLISDYKKRQHYGKNGRKAVEQIYSLQVQRTKLLNIINSK